MHLIFLARCSMKIRDFAHDKYDSVLVFALNIVHILCITPDLFQKEVPGC